MANTANMIAIPGKAVRCGASLKKSLPVESIAPHSGVGAFTPRPRKLKPDVERIADATLETVSDKPFEAPAKAPVGEENPLEAVRTIEETTTETKI